MALDIKVDLSNVKNMYETTFLVTPELKEDDYKKVAKKFEDLIKKDGGEITNIEHWGLRKLEYPIEGKSTAYYCYVEFDASPKFISKLEQEYIYDEGVIRYLTVRVDKDHAAFNKKRREQGFGKKKEAN